MNSEAFKTFAKWGMWPLALAVLTLIIPVAIDHFDTDKTAHFPTKEDLILPLIILWVSSFLKIVQEMKYHSDHLQNMSEAYKHIPTNGKPIGFKTKFYNCIGNIGSLANELKDDPDPIKSSMIDFAQYKTEEMINFRDGMELISRDRAHLLKVMVENAGPKDDFIYHEKKLFFPLTLDEEGDDDRVDEDASQEEVQSNKGFLSHPFRDVLIDSIMPLKGKKVLVLSCCYKIKSDKLVLSQDECDMLRACYAYFVMSKGEYESHKEAGLPWVKGMYCEEIEGFQLWLVNLTHHDWKEYEHLRNTTRISVGDCDFAYTLKRQSYEYEATVTVEPFGNNSNAKTFVKCVTGERRVAQRAAIRVTKRVIEDIVVE